MFNVEEQFEKNMNHLEEWLKINRLNPKFVVGISGGVDSSVCAASLVKKFGKESVIGVLMPNGEQSDIDCSYQLVNHLGIEYLRINIGETYKALINAFKIENEDPDECYGFRTNTPARLRMTTLYGIAALKNAVVINTCNKSENVMGFSTLYGDHAGSYSILDQYTKTEVRAFGKFLGLPENLVNKLPTDGMCGTGDEQKLSEQLEIPNFTYERLDKLIRNEEHDFNEKEEVAIMKKYACNKFKCEIVNIPHYEPNLPINPMLI